MRVSYRDYVLLLIAAWFALGVCRLEAAPQHEAELRSGALLIGGQPALTLGTRVSIEVTGMLAEVEINQTFRNAGATWVEGVYSFPLPDQAAVNRMQIEVDGRRIVGEIREKEEARRTYVAAREAGQSTSLVSQQRPNRFTSRVANIPPGGEIQVMIGYVQTLEYRDGRFSLRFPMTETPRYGEDSPEASAAASVAAPVNLSVNLHAGFELARLESVHHPVEIETLDERYRIDLMQDMHRGDRDFELIWEPRLGDAPQAALFSEQIDGDTYALLMILPPAPEHRSLQPRELILVIDTSGSMEGASLQQARESLLMAVGSLQPEDRFNLIEFNSEARALFAAPVDATPSAVGQAVARIDRLTANGGTEMAPALDLALAGQAPDGFVRQVVFVTDGAIGNETALFRRIQERLGRARLFTVGIGSAPNTYFMRKAAEFGRGSYTYVGKLDEVAEKMDRLLTRLEHPAMTNTCIDWPQQAEAYPRQLPDLYLGEPLVVAAKSSLFSGKVLACGTTPAYRWEDSLIAKQARSHHAIGTLWARRKIESLGDDLSLGADPELVRGQILETALAHQLVSRYTSFVAVDRTPARSREAALRRAGIANSPPNSTTNANPSSLALALPQTDAGTVMRVTLGLMLLLLAGVLGGRLRDEQ